MGLESQTQGIQVNPSSLIGLASPVVEPRSTALLADAFRQGIVTADDIHARVGELGKLKTKAEVMGLQEQTSPEAVAARAAARDASTATNTLAGAQAGAALPGVGAKAAAAEEDVDFHRAATAYGPEAIQAYFKYAPLVPGYDGTPKTNDGKPDWMTVAREGANLSQQIEKKAQAALRATVHGQPQTVKEGSLAYTIEKNSVGEDITDPAKKQALNSQATAPLSFKFIKPGGVSAPAPAPADAPVVAPSVPAPVVQPAVPADPVKAGEARARIANRLGSQAALALSDAEALKLDAPVVQPTVAAAPAAAVKPTIELNTYVPGKGLVSVIEPEKPETIIHMTGEQQKGLAQAAFTTEQIKGLSESFSNLSKNEPWLTGPVMARLTAFTHPENWNKNVGDFERAKIAILANLAKGIYHETGVLSDKDIERYQRAVPSAKDTAPVAESKLVGLQKDIFSSIDTNIQTMRAQGQKITPLLDGMQTSAKQALQSLQQAPAGASKPAGGVLTLPTGRKIQRDANGNYFEVK